MNGASERGLGRGVLHQDLAAGRFQLSRHQPSAALRPFVDFHWIVRWDLSGQQPYEQKILPHPNVNLAFEESGSAVFGVDRKLFVRRIGGHGKALGVRFSPGGFRPFWNAPVSRLTDRTIPAAEVFGIAAEAAQEAIMQAPGDAAMVAQAEEFLARELPSCDPVAESVHRLLDVTGNIAADIHDRIPAAIAKRSVIARVPVTDEPGHLGEQVGARLAAAEQGHFGSGAQGVRHDGTANE